MSSKIVSAAEAIASIPNGATVASAGVIGWITPDHVLEALGNRFRKTGSPRDLTFFFPCGTGDAVGIRGMDHVAQEGMMKRIVSGSYINPTHPRTGERPALMKLLRENRIEAYSWPLGATMHWLREVARKSPGYLTRIGLGTYVDPDLGGGKFSERCRDDLIQKVQFNGETMLFYPTWPLDVVIVRASSADASGALSWEDEPLISANIGLILAAKASGGRVIAQVRRIVARHERKASQVNVPGYLVDAVVVVPDMMMTTDIKYDPRFLGTGKHASEFPRVPMGPEKVIARRAAREVRPHELSIFGFGAAADIPLTMAEDGLFDEGRLADYWFTTEHGSHGGMVLSNWQFSANLDPLAIMDGLYQFDLIDGGLCRFAALAFAEYDAAGSVNVSRFGSANPGAGGFIDIAENARRLVFTGTFSTGGLRTSLESGRLRIIQEGAISKFVANVESLTYSVGQGVGQRGQSAMIVTERAVFEVTPSGLMLTEVAPGIDVRAEVLDRMAFPVLGISSPLPTMDISLFCDQPELEICTAASK